MRESIKLYTQILCKLSKTTAKRAQRHIRRLELDCFSDEIMAKKKSRKKRRRPHSGAGIIQHFGVFGAGAICHCIELIKTRAISASMMVE